MNLNKFLTKTISALAVAIAIVSCDDDFNSVGREVIGDVNFEDNIYTSAPLAYNRAFERVQSSGIISLNQQGRVERAGISNDRLGVYDDPTYGRSTYSVLAQLEPERFNAVYGQNARLDSVVLSLPYFSTRTETSQNDDNETINTYRLDSVYGNGNVKLSIYRSNYLLRDFDPTVVTDDEGSQRQLYFSDDFDGITSIEETLLAKVDDFTPKADEIEIEVPSDDEDEEPTTTRLTPRLRVVLGEDLGTSTTLQKSTLALFQQWFLDREGGPEFSNANNFRNYFRGIYIKAEPEDDSGSLVVFNIGNGDITLHYSFDTESDDDSDETPTSTGSLTLNFRNHVANVIEKESKPEIDEGLSNQDPNNGVGAENLYLQGGEGSYGVLELFNQKVAVDGNGNFIIDEEGNPVPDENSDKTELDFLRDQNWLINDASIKLYIDQNKLTSTETSEPNRIFIFDVNNGQVLFDYLTDRTNNTTIPLFSRINHLGFLSRDSDEKGDFYQIRITRHLLRVLNEGEDNVKLGISVSQNVNVASMALGSSNTINPDDENPNDEIIPVSSIISHEGTILYGNTNEVPEDKRLELEIFYTKSKGN